MMEGGSGGFLFYDDGLGVGFSEMEEGQYPGSASFS